MLALALCAALALVPAGAAAQTLSAEVHPGLLFSAEDIPLLKERIQREPYATWWQIVLQRAQNTPATFADERAEVRLRQVPRLCLADDRRCRVCRARLGRDAGGGVPPRGGDLGEPHNEGEVVGPVRCGLRHPARLCCGQRPTSPAGDAVDSRRGSRPPVEGHRDWRGGVWAVPGQKSACTRLRISTTGTSARTAASGWRPWP